MKKQDPMKDYNTLKLLAIVYPLLGVGACSIGAALLSDNNGTGIILWLIGFALCVFCPVAICQSAEDARVKWTEERLKPKDKSG